jgi:hypothetical protein
MAVDSLSLLCILLEMRIRLTSKDVILALDWAAQSPRLAALRLMIRSMLTS